MPRQVVIQVKITDGDMPGTRMDHRIIIPSISEPILKVIEDVLIRVLDSIR